LLEAGDIDITYVTARVFGENPDAYQELFCPTDFVPEYQQTVILTSRHYMDKNPETVRGLLRAYSASVDWIVEHPEEAAAIYAREAELDEDLARQIVTDAISFDHWGVAFNADALELLASSIE